MAAAKTKNAPTAAQVAEAFRTIADWVELTGGVSTSTAAAADGEVEQFDEDEVKALAVGELRKLAAELGLKAQKVKSEILAEMASKGLFESDDEEEDEDDEEPEDDETDEDEDDTSDEEEDDEDGDEDELTRDDLEEMDLKALRALAKEEGLKREEYIKADKDSIIDLLLGDEEEDEEDEDEDDEDGEDAELTEEEIRQMSLAELKDLAKELEVKIPATIAKNRKKIADKIIAESSEDE